MRQKLCSVLLALTLVLTTVLTTALTGCGGKEGTAGYEPFVTAGESRCEIGHRDKQKWVFVKDGGAWQFDGVYVKIGKAWEQVVDHRGTDMKGGLFKAYGLSASAAISSVAEEPAGSQKRLVVKGTGFTAVFEAGDSPYVMRDIRLAFDSEVTTFEDMVRFSLTTPAGKFDESGYIATRAAAESKLYLPYAFPAIFSTLATDSYRVRVTDVVDWYETHDAFKTASRQENARGSIEVGLSSAIGTIAAGSTQGVREYFKFSNADENDLYAEIGSAYEVCRIANPLDAETMTRLDNRAVSSWDALAAGLVSDISDPRARNEGMLNATADYGYSDGSQWGSSFSTMNVTNGLVRYAASTGDPELQAMALDYALAMVRPVNGKNWIEPTSFAPEGYFHYAAQDGSFSNDVDGGEEGATALSTWKYYDRVYKLGEIAKITDNEELREGFFRTMPFVRALKTEDGYKQPVSFDLYTRKPLTGYEGGGSAGATAMWSYIHFLAYDMAAPGAERDAYLADALGAIDYASSLGFEDMRLMRNYPKPLAIAWVVRTCVKAYEVTCDTVYLERAEHVLDGLYYFFYNNTNPYTTFATNGWGYACSRERWENTLEMYGALKFVAPLLAYSSDTKLLDLYAAAGYTYSWTIPVNGYPEGNPASRWDGLDGVYIGFEFPTGAQGDNPEADGGSQSSLRQVKALYGAGEAFQLQQMYSAYAECLDPAVTLVCYSAVKDDYSTTDNGFRLYNPGAALKTTVVRFKNLAAGAFELTENGNSRGVFDAATLNNGLTFAVAAGGVSQLELKQTDRAPQASAEADVQSFSLRAAAATSSGVALDASSLPEADSYLVYAAESATMTGARLNRLTPAAAAGYVDARPELQSSYYRVEAIRDGRVFARSQVLEVPAVTLTGLVQEDFAAASGWSVDNCTFKSDGYAGYLVPKNIDEGVSSLSRTFTVDPAVTPLFEIFPISKNVRSTWKVVLSANGREVEAVPATSLIERRSYRCDLSALNLPAGPSQIEVKIIVAGRNRGLAVERLRFLGESTGGGTMLERTAGDGELDGRTLTVRQSVRTDDALTATFRPDVFSTLSLQFSGARILDDVTVTVAYLQDGAAQSVRLSGRLDEHKQLRLDLGKALAGVTGSIDATFTVSIANAKATLTVLDLLAERASETTDVAASTFGVAGGASFDGEGGLAARGGYAYRNLFFSLDRTQQLRLDVAAAASGTTWSLRFWDGNEGTAETVLAEGAGAGSTLVELGERLGKTGVVSGQLRLYVNGSLSGASYGFLETLPVLASGKQQLTLTELRVSGTDASLYRYLSFAVADLSDGAEWRVYVRTAQGCCELRAPTECRYPVKYFRGKRGFFKYDLSQAGVDLGGDFTVVVALAGSGGTLRMEDIRLESNNQVPTGWTGEV